MNPASATPPFIMATDNGTHPPEKWADLIAKLVFPISPKIEEERKPLAEDAQAKIAEGLTPIIRRIIERERVLLEVSNSRFDQLFDGHEYLEMALKVIYDIADATLWSVYLRSHEDYLQWELARNFNHVQHVERLWHADTHISEAGGKYKARHTGEL